MTRGVLLINLGTPDKPTVGAVARYLLRFLRDKRVIDLPALFRYLLVYAFIVPFRSLQTARAYQLIWTRQGSPLMVHNHNIATALQQALGAEYQVALSMRYGSPSITTALKTLNHCDSISIVPLYPHYSSATSGSALEEALHVCAAQEHIPSLHLIDYFYRHPAYIKAQARRITDYLQQDTFLLFSYHGIPERQIRKSGCPLVCKHSCPSTTAHTSCYKAQCYQSSELVARALALSTDSYATAFQSRLGKTPWIQPYTEEILTQLIDKNIKKLAIVCPSFVTDCLETLEEIGIRTKALWYKLGGEEFTLIPCMNDDEEWIKALCEMIQKPQEP